MKNIVQNRNKIHLLEELAQQNSIINKIHPLVKLIVTIVYIVFILSFDKHAISQLVPFVFYLVIIITLNDIPISMILKVLLFSSPFILGIGILNPIFDQTIMINIHGINISSGWISFFSLLLKYIFTILASVLLIATTSISDIAYALNILKIPKIFILQLLLLYRYITLIIEEVIRVLTAYNLRTQNHKGVEFKAWGSLVGNVLLRSFDRSQRVYSAMVLRGFSISNIALRKIQFSKSDFIYLFLWIALFTLFRAIKLY